MTNPDEPDISVPPNDLDNNSNPSSAVTLSQPGGRSIFGGLTAAICFFLPWAQVSCMGEVKTVSGIEIAQQQNIFYLVLLSAVVIVICVFHMRSTKRFAEGKTQIIGASILGLGVLAYNYFQIKKGMNTPGGMITADALNFSWQLGAYGTVCGLLLALYDAASMHVVVEDYRKTQRSEPGSLQSGLAGAAIDLEKKLTVVERQAVSQIRETGLAAFASAQPIASGLKQSSLRISEWISQHKVLVSSIAVMTIMLATTAYALRPTPEKDGRTVGEMFLKCNDEYVQEVEALQRRLTEKFAREPAHTRSAVFGEISARMKSPEIYREKCLAAANEEQSTASRRWSSDIRRLSIFDSSIMANKQSIKYVASGMNDDGASLPTFLPLREIIDRIRPPEPSIQKLNEDLIGKSIDNWHFAYLSEISGTTVETRSVKGDSLSLRVRLNLEDAYTHGQFVAVAFITYVLADDAWQLSGIRPLIYSEAPEVDYNMNGQIFLAGKWRMGDHYATFTPDGHWSGVWDNGSKADGDWRLSKGALVRSINGSDWQTARILTFTRDRIEFDGGYGSPMIAERVN
jgi:hypothetical protein